MMDPHHTHVQHPLSFRY